MNFDLASCLFGISIGISFAQLVFLVVYGRRYIFRRHTQEQPR
jgi:hypothetical protein